MMDALSEIRERLIADMFQAYEARAMSTVIELGSHARQKGLASERTEWLLAVAQQSLGRLDEAKTSFRQLVLRWPGRASHWNNLGVVARQTGDDSGAEEAFIRALQLLPDDWELHYNLGLLYLQQRRLLDARKHLLLASDAAQGDIEVRLQAAHACHLSGDTAQQTRLLGDAEAWPPLAVEPALLLASMLGAQGRQTAALAALDKAMQQEPDAHGSNWLRLLIQRAALLERGNAMTPARHHLQQIRSIHEMSIQPFTSVLELELAQLEAAMAVRDQDWPGAILHYRKAAGLEQDPAALASIRFGLARALDRLGQTREALVEARQAHVAQAELAAALVPDLLQPGASPLLLAHDRTASEDFRQWRPAPPAVQASPVFIVGFPRSGTTLLEQMLDAHPDYQSMDEQPFIHELSVRMTAAGQPYPEALGDMTAEDIQQLRAVYWSLVGGCARLGSRQRLVDKNPLNMLALPMIMRLFPDARIVLCLRHPLDVLLSCYLQSFRSPAFMLMCSDIRRLANAYRQAFEQWHDQLAVFTPRVMNWRYETVIRDFPGQCQALADFLQMSDASPLADFADHAQRKGFISTPSYAQVTEGIYQRGIGRWQACRELFEPVIEELAPLMRRLGYSF